MGNMAEVSNDLKAVTNARKLGLPGTYGKLGSPVSALYGVGLEEQSKGVFRVNTSRGAVMYYPGSNKWQHKGKIFRGDMGQFANWLTDFIRMNPSEAVG